MNLSEEPPVRIVSFETYYVEIDPDTLFKGEPHEGNVYEYVFGLQGKVQIIVEGKTFAIHANEFLQFQANCPHEYKCPGKKIGSGHHADQLPYINRNHGGLIGNENYDLRPSPHP